MLIIRMYSPSSDSKAMTVTIARACNREWRGKGKARDPPCPRSLLGWLGFWRPWHYQAWPCALRWDALGLCPSLSVLSLCPGTYLNEKNFFFSPQQITRPASTSRSAWCQRPARTWRYLTHQHQWQRPQGLWKVSQQPEKSQKQQQ